MGERLRSLTLILVLLSAAVFVGSFLAQWWQGGLSRLPETPDVAVPGRVRVEVLNGGGVSGVARKATRQLRDLGFDVVYFGNAEPFTPDSSVVLDRVGRPDAARAVAEALGIPETQVEKDSTLYVDVTVRLGPEWPGSDLPVDAGEDRLPWWDLRRFLRGR